MGVDLKSYLGRVTVADGAWGTMLQAKGMTSDDCPEEWNLSHPDRVSRIHNAYVDAGSEILLTNTFQASPLALARRTPPGQPDP